MVVTPSTPARRDPIADLVDDRADPRAQLELERADRRDVAGGPEESASRERHPERRQVSRVEARVDGGEAHQAVDQQAGARQQHERGGDLNDDEGAAQPEFSGEAVAPRSAALNAVVEIEPRRLQRRQHAEDERREQRHAGGEQQHAGRS